MDGTNQKQRQQEEGQDIVQPSHSSSKGPIQTGESTQSGFG